MSAQRTCGACGGSGWAYVWRGGIRYQPKCLVCAGSGQVDAKASRADAEADAETLRAFADVAWDDSARPGEDLYDTPDHQASNLLLILDRANLGRGGRAKRHINKGRTPLGLICEAARAAFRAVPLLRGE